MDNKHIATDILKVYAPSVLLANAPISMINKRSERKDIMAAFTYAETYKRLEDYRSGVWCMTLLDHFSSSCTVLRRA